MGHADDAAIRPWFEQLARLVPGLTLYDAHIHTGENDPDLFRCDLDTVLDALETVRGRGVVFSSADPNGYYEANDRCIAEAVESNGRLVAFCRVDPTRDGAGESRRCLDAGARGIKLHPRAEQFVLTDPGVEEIFEVASERSVPLIIHAGRGIPTLARDALLLAQRFSDVPIILAHAAVCDLSWLRHEIARHPNVYFDTSWWNAVDLVALFAFVPPGRVLYASDIPYGTPFRSSVLTMRCALQAGVTREQLPWIMGLQLERLLEGKEPEDLGPAPGLEPSARGYGILLERVHAFCAIAAGRILAGDDGHEAMSLARLACDTGIEEGVEVDVCRSVLSLLDRQQGYEEWRTPDDVEYPGMHPMPQIVITAACIARTPAVPLPRDPDRLVDIRRATMHGHKILAHAARRRETMSFVPGDE